MARGFRFLKLGERVLDSSIFLAIYFTLWRPTIVCTYAGPTSLHHWHALHRTWRKILIWLPHWQSLLIPRPILQLNSSTTCSAVLAKIAHKSGLFPNVSLGSGRSLMCHLPPKRKWSSLEVPVIPRCQNCWISYSREREACHQGGYARYGRYAEKPQRVCWFVQSVCGRCTCTREERIGVLEAAEECLKIATDDLVLVVKDGLRDKREEGIKRSVSEGRRGHKQALSNLTQYWHWRGREENMGMSSVCRRVPNMRTIQTGQKQDTALMSRHILHTFDYKLRLRGTVVVVRRMEQNETRSEKAELV